jgi:hypothetical protein
VAGVTVDPGTRRSVLEQLARKEITADQAAALLRGEEPETAAEEAQDPPAEEADAAAESADPDEETTITKSES